MFDQSQQLLTNLDSDQENLFEGVEDIKLDVSESIYEEDFLYGQAFEARLHKLGLGDALPEFYSVEKYYASCSYLYNLQETKSVLLRYLGEENPFGYSGVNENFFKR